MEAQITLEAVRQFIWRLPEEQRVVLMLIAVEGLSYKEAADALELPMGTVTSRLARARIAINEYVHHTDHNRKSLQQSR
ncbi:MAG: sigma factor-like helix-turn-helix DNA-binding protein [Gammaproteobacteria bacterium]